MGEPDRSASLGELTYSDLHALAARQAARLDGHLARVIGDDGYKAPTSIAFRGELARTATGKLWKAKLRAPYWTGRERQIN